MKYYFLHITKNLAGEETVSTFAYDTKEAAETVWHRELAYDMDESTPIVESLAMVINSAGNTELSKKWNAPAPENAE